MEYSSATDSYEAEFLENILDTKFSYGVPYKIDKEKYNKVLEKYNEKSRFKEADVVKFHFDYSIKKDDDNNDKIYLYAFFIFPKNSPEGSDDMYDCILFDDYKYDEKHKEACENFIHSLVQTIITVDHDAMDKLISEKKAEKTKLSYEIEKLCQLQVDKNIDQ